VVHLQEVDTAWLLARRYFSSLVDFMRVQSRCNSPLYSVYRMYPVYLVLLNRDECHMSVIENNWQILVVLNDHHVASYKTFTSSEMLSKQNKSLLSAIGLQCFDAVGWAVGRASGLRKPMVGCWHALSLARCRFGYGPADTTATHCLLIQ